MKKFVSKFLPIAVLVLALCLSSVAVSAAALNPNVTYVDGKVAVSATAANESGGDVVILATRQNGTQDKAKLDEAVANIVYVDQASASNINFNFIPKTDVVGNTISVFMGGAGADAVSVNEIATNNVIMEANGGTLANYTVNRETGKAFALPTPVKAGFTFEGWYTSATFEEGTKISEISADTNGEVKVYANYTANATDDFSTGYCASAADADDKKGVISVTAKIEAYASATRFGFLVYRADYTANKVEIEATNGTLTADGFYTVVFGIPSANFNEDIVIMPFIADANSNVTYGAAKTYKVGDTTNYLGTEAQLKAAFGIPEATN